MAKERGIDADGEAIRNKRKAVGMTQEQLAARCDCSVRTIRSAEKGSRVDVTTLSRIGNVLGVPVHSVSAAVSEKDEMERNRLVALEWEDAFFHSDIERLLPLHHPEVETELPGSEGMPAGGNTRGLHELRAHFEGVFANYECLEVHSKEFTAIGDKVFHRSHSTWRVKPIDQTFTLTFINDFTFKDGKVIHRVTVQDLSEVREALGE